MESAVFDHGPRHRLAGFLATHPQKRIYQPIEIAGRKVDIDGSAPLDRANHRHHGFPQFLARGRGHFEVNHAGIDVRRKVDLCGAEHQG